MQKEIPSGHPLYPLSFSVLKDNGYNGGPDGISLTNMGNILVINFTKILHNIFAYRPSVFFMF